MNAYTVDENVPIVANDSVLPKPKAPQADSACRLACVQALKRVVRSGILIVDSAGEVVENYRSHLKRRGQPGIGDAFFKHVIDHQFNRRKVRRTSLTKNAQGEFETFPADTALQTFDPSDRIYVALALAAPERPHILNAVDSDYAEHKTALEAVGVRVHEICPQCIRKSRGGLAKKTAGLARNLRRVRSDLDVVHSRNP
jgi:hypothetical protein